MSVIKASELEPSMLLVDSRYAWAVTKTDEMVQVVWHNYSNGRKEPQVLGFDDELELTEDAEWTQMVNSTMYL